MMLAIVDCHPHILKRETRQSSVFQYIPDTFLNSRYKRAWNNATNNSINKVPPELSLLPNLTSLKLEGNCFKIPRPAVLAKGTPALLQYLRDRIS